MTLRIASSGLLSVLALFACTESLTPTPIAIGGGPVASPPPSAPMFDPSETFLRCPGVDPPVVGATCNSGSFPAPPPASKLGSSTGSTSGFTTTFDNVTCEYGHDLDPSCNPLYRCNGVWTRQEPTTCVNRCPPTIDDIVPGQACSDRSVGCSFVRGTCACVGDVVDGGADAGGSRAHWVCAPPPAGGCPAQRPGLGSDCVVEMTCDYGSALLRRDLAFACVDGRWVQSDSPSISP